jgi:type IV secretory pathway TraG/TraD family ATPase VirD4
MNLAAQPLRMMPSDQKNRRAFTAKDYCEKRQGWIFITSTPMYLEAMNPLHTLWIALLIMRTSGMGYRKDLPVLHFVIEEAASIIIHQFHKALLRLRKTRCPVVIAIQNYSDLEAGYGKYAPSMFSQAFTKVIGRTSDPDSARRLAETIGKKRTKRLRKTIMLSKGLLGIGTSKQVSYTEAEEDIDIASRDLIENLPDRDLLVIQPGKLTYTRLPIIDLPDKPRIAARAMPRLEDREMDGPDEPEPVAPTPAPLITL